MKTLHTAMLAFLIMLALDAGQAATFQIADGDVAGLIAAIQTANTNGEANTINLAPNGTYVLMAVAEFPMEYGAPGAVGLPVVRSVLTINGNGATIRRSNAPGIPQFTVLAVSGKTAACASNDGCYLADLTLNATTIMGGEKGGLHLDAATARVQGSTITQNVGGIISFCGRLTIVNSTISFNTDPGGYGGGGLLQFQFGCIYPFTNISFTTFYENNSWAGDSIATAYSEPGTVVVKNSILASPARRTQQACWQSWGGAIVSAGHNIVADASCGFAGPGDVVIADPMLGPLANNGGPTPTHLPLTGSPAIDAGPAGACTDVSGNPVTTDQRAAARPRGPACDAGAVEAVRFNVCLLYEPTKAVQSGATYPVKLQLCDAAGNNLSSPAITLHASSVIRVSNSITGPVQDSGNANPDNDFRFDAALGSTGGYIFNLGTKGLATGSYNLNFTVTGDPSVYAAPFQVK